MAMSRKDYEAAAALIQTYNATPGETPEQPETDAAEGYETLVEVFSRFFAADNPRFDAARFRKACEPGANVKARGRKAKVAS
jgi:hypothetical protein